MAQVGIIPFEITLELGVAALLALLILIYFMGRIWKLSHNKYFWLIFLVSIGAFAFAMYDLGNRQTFWNYIGVSSSWLGWAYGGGQTLWQDYGAQITTYWASFINFFATHTSISYVIMLTVGGVVGITLVIIMVTRFGVSVFRLFRKKTLFWGIKSLIVSIATVLIIEANLMIIDPNFTNAIKGLLLTGLSSVVFSDVLLKLSKGGLKAVLYGDET